MSFWSLVKIKAELKAEGVLAAGLYQLDFYRKPFQILCLPPSKTLNERVITGFAL